MKSTLAISMRVTHPAGYYEPRDSISHDWIRYLARFGVTPVLIPNAVEDVESYLDARKVDAIILSGGNNLERLSSEPDDLEIADTSALRDRTERAVIEYALTREARLLGVCRGLQMLNVWFGGSLERDLSDREEAKDLHVATEHEIEIVEPCFGEWFGSSSGKTNSFHDQGVTLSTLAEDLRAFAVSRDGVVEGLYHADHPIVAIQWHPERPNQSRDWDERLIEALVGRREWPCG